MIGRVIADKLSKSLDATVVVENKPGAGGTIGAAAAAKADPDGYTIMIGYIGNLGYAPTIYNKLPYDPLDKLRADYVDREGSEYPGREPEACRFRRSRT